MPRTTNFSKAVTATFAAVAMTLSGLGGGVLPANAGYLAGNSTSVTVLDATVADSKIQATFVLSEFMKRRNEADKTNFFSDTGLVDHFMVVEAHLVGSSQMIEKSFSSTLPDGATGVTTTKNALSSNGATDFKNERFVELGSASFAYDVANGAFQSICFEFHSFTSFDGADFNPYFFCSNSSPFPPFNLSNESIEASLTIPSQETPNPWDISSTLSLLDLALVSHRNSTPTKAGQVFAARVFLLGVNGFNDFEISTYNPAEAGVGPTEGDLGGSIMASAVDPELTHQFTDISSSTLDFQRIRICWDVHYFSPAAVLTTYLVCSESSPAALPTNDQNQDSGSNDQNQDSGSGSAPFTRTELSFLTGPSISAENGANVGDTIVATPATWDTENVNEVDFPIVWLFRASCAEERLTSFTTSVDQTLGVSSLDFEIPQIIYPRIFEGEGPPTLGAAITVEEGAVFLFVSRFYHSQTSDGVQAVEDGISFSLPLVVGGGTCDAQNDQSVDTSDVVRAAPYTGPVLNTPSITRSVAAGGKVVIPGSNLSGVSGVEIGGAKATVVINSDGELEITVPAGLAAGTYDLVVVSSSGRLTVQNAITVSGSSEGTGSATPSTKRMDDDSAKVWVFDVVGAGKVQIFVNGKEIAWVNTTDSNNSKLTNGYLVRTVELKAGKNVIEVFVDGERERRTVYTG